MDNNLPHIMRSLLLASTDLLPLEFVLEQRQQLQQQEQQQEQEFRNSVIFDKYGFIIPSEETRKRLLEWKYQRKKAVANPTWNANANIGRGRMHCKELCRYLFHTSSHNWHKNKQDLFYCNQCECVMACARCRCCSTLGRRPFNKGKEIE